VKRPLQHDADPGVLSCHLRPHRECSRSASPGQTLLWAWRCRESDGVAEGPPMDSLPEGRT
jgi:hypothetical protein